MYRSILVPLDGSGFAEQALPVALALAGASGARLELLMVHQSFELWDTAARPAQMEERWSADLRERERDYLAGIADRLRAAGVSDPGTDLAEGPVASSIAAYARHHAIDIIVLTTHARSGLERAWLGSVAGGVIREAASPVLVVRPVEPSPDVLQPVERWRRILVAWDGSEEATAALDQATSLANLMDAELIIAHSIAPYSGPASPYIPHTAELDREILEQRREDAELSVAKAKDRVAERAPDIVARGIVEAHPNPARGILQLTGQYHVDLIAMGTHGRGGLGRVLLGSVADKVIRGADRPVLVCRRPKD
jgi:nucleotide-binding universal stress UspA family protein